MKYIKVHWCEVERFINTAFITAVLKNDRATTIYMVDGDSFVADESVDEVMLMICASSDACIKSYISEVSRN